MTMKMIMGRSIAWLLVGVLLAGGCSSSGGPGDEDWHSSNPPWLMQSAIEAGQSGDRKHLARLVAGLDHDDPAVRMMSIHALQRITGTRLGYHPYGSAVHRHAAVTRWKQAVATGQFVEEGTAGGQSMVDAQGQTR
jgi:hypothetical protein